jgi:hypothetical protein
MVVTVVRLERFDETLYVPQKIDKVQTKLEGMDNSLYVPKKHNAHKKSPVWCSSRSSP